MDLFDIYQQDRINAVAVTADNAARDAREAKGLVSQVRELEAKINKLSMINMALWEIIKADTQRKDDDLYTMVQDIDLRDGRLDGKVKNEIKKCHKCGRTMSRRHQRCLYCRSPALDPDLFESI